jgi:hypothetical protein
MTESARDPYLESSVNYAVRNEQHRGDVLPFSDEDHAALVRPEIEREHNETFTASYFGTELEDNDAKPVERENWLPGMEGTDADPNHYMNTHFPLKFGNPNIGQQFVERIRPLFDKLRDRPVSNKFGVRGYAITRNEQESTFNPNGEQMTLRHNGQHVGEVTWSPTSGFVRGLDVDRGHRHMTAKLLQEAHDYSRKMGGYGPSWSHDLNSYSAKLMERFNPEAAGLKKYKTDNDLE